MEYETRTLTALLRTILGQASHYEPEVLDTLLDDFKLGTLPGLSRLKDLTIRTLANAKGLIMILDALNEAERPESSMEVLMDLLVQVPKLRICHGVCEQAWW